MKALSAALCFGTALLFATGCTEDTRAPTASLDDESVVVGKRVAKKKECTAIQDGTLQTTDGRTIETGYDVWGYNYQGHMFNGGYCDSYRDAAWCQPYKEVHLTMKWNEAWLSNMDCNDDGSLDRHDGFNSYLGSGAWLTNHQSDTYEDEDGKSCKWTYFVKIVAAPADAVVLDGVWHSTDGVEIGASVWGEFATIQSVYNDPCAGDHGIEYLSPTGPGFGKFKP